MENTQRNKTIQSINDCKNMDELIVYGKEICAFLEHEKEWKSIQLIRDVYRTKIKLLSN